MTRKELLHLLDLAERDLRTGMAKITEFRAHLANTPIPEPAGETHRCPIDGLVFPSERRLDEHLHNVHPEHAA